MRIRIDELPAEGIRVDLHTDLAWANQAVSYALEGAVEQLEGDLWVRPVGTGATVHGQAAVVVRRICDRCLASLRQHIEGEIDLYFDTGRLMGDADVGLEPDDLDMGFVVEGELDLGAALGEFFLLESPSRLLCEDPDVTRVEEGPCSLATERSEPEPDVDPRFAALKNFRPT